MPAWSSTWQGRAVSKGTICGRMDTRQALLLLCVLKKESCVCVQGQRDGGRTTSNKPRNNTNHQTTTQAMTPFSPTMPVKEPRVPRPSGRHPTRHLQPACLHDPNTTTTNHATTAYMTRQQALRHPKMSSSCCCSCCGGRCGGRWCCCCCCCW